MNPVAAPISLPLHADEAAAILAALDAANQTGRIGSLDTQRRTWIAHRLTRLVEKQVPLR